MFHLNKKYLKNLQKHRINIFLQNRIKYGTENENILESNTYYKVFNINTELYFNTLKFGKKKSQIKKIFYPLNNNLEPLNLFFSIHKSTNDKFSDYFKSLNLVNKINFSYFIKMFLNIFRYSYLLKFIFELILLLFLLYYLFHKGTFY